MARAVLDSSAILAVLRSEPGAEQVEEVMADSLVSVINETEVISKLIWRGETWARAQEIVASLPYQSVDVDRRQAWRAAALWEITRAQGLSLGDRCCLALAEREKVPVLTMDKIWGEVSIGVEIRLIERRGRNQGIETK
jgi:PIN domain nuclease of toxin-antitoxin system